MNERRNDLEIVIGIPRIASRIQTRIDLLFTMSEIPQARPVKERVRSDVSRTIYSKPRSSIPSGGARRDRTDDLMLAKHALSQLSYGPVPEDECLFRALFARSPSPALRRSGLRSRGPAEPKLQSSEGWWAWEDLNFRPHAYQARALTN